ncbi:ZIP family metal transporter [Nocardioides sp.]|uniref:Putative membrane protein n=2 Tax=root TaxID=1 RepID=A0A2P2BX55_9ZZZZ
MTPVAQAAVLVSFPVAAAAIGSGVALVRPPGPRLVSGIQHFAAGVVLAALAGEVLPRLREEGNLPWAVIGFTVGVLTMLALAAYGRSRDEARTNVSTRTLVMALPLGMLVAVGIDLLIDGLLVGLGVTLGATAGLILTVALTIEILFLSLSLAAELTETGLGRLQAGLICAGLGLITAVGAIGGVLVLGGASDAVLAAVLAFGSAALMYLAVEELLVEAHEQDESSLLTAMFFAGFLVIYVLGELAA